MIKGNIEHLTRPNSKPLFYPDDYITIYLVTKLREEGIVSPDIWIDHEKVVKENVKRIKKRLLITLERIEL